jgi:biotin/methionine sulfoxide reductase
LTEKIVPHSSHWGAFAAEIKDGRFVKAHPFAHDPAPSELLRSMTEAVYHRSRVGQPMVREGWLRNGPVGTGEGRGAEPFVPVSWDEALDLVERELRRVISQHGNASVFGGSYGWSSAGRFHHAKTLLQRFLNTIGGFTAQIHTYSIAAGYAVIPHVLGDTQSVIQSTTTWDSVAEHAELVVAFGGVPLKNLQVTSGGAGAHGAEGWLKTARKRGVRFVNISPLREDMPDFVDAEWIPIRPNTDTALMLALAHEWIASGRADRAFLERCTVGFDRWARYVRGDDDGAPKDAAWAAAITAIPAERIRRLARDMAGAPTHITTAWSLQRAEHGEQPFWGTVALAAMLGGIGLPGLGFSFGYGSMGGMGEPREDVPSVTMTAGKNNSGSAIPVSRIADMLLHPGEPYDFDGARKTYPDVRLVYWCGGNPFHHHQDINRLIRAWRRPETIIIQDPWWTATARHADIVLPATTTLERNDIGSSSKDRFILAMHQAIEPFGEARNDFDIFCNLADRFGTRAAFDEGRDEMAWLRHLYETVRERAAQKQVHIRDFDTFWAQGHVEVPPPAVASVQFARFRVDPEGNRLKTPSGKIEIFSERVTGFGYADCPGYPAWLEPQEWLGGALTHKYPLHMISNQPRTRLHGQLDNGAVSGESKIAGREPIAMHPDDAAARGIADGDVVRVFNARGALLAGAVVTDKVRPGVVQLATGAWYDPETPGAVGALDRHGNPNVLTLDRGTSRLGQGPSAQSALVEVARAEGALPDAAPFEPPPTRART